MDKIYMTMAISLLKDLEKNYTVAMSEASNDKLYKIFKNSFDKISTMQRNTFNIMNKNKMYTLKNVKSDEIKTSYNTINKEFKKI